VNKRAYKLVRVQLRMLFTCVKITSMHRVSKSGIKLLSP